LVADRRKEELSESGEGAVVRRLGTDISAEEDNCCLHVSTNDIFVSDQPLVENKRSASKALT
jgi:hypothetical protein